MAGLAALGGSTNGAMGTNGSTASTDPVLYFNKDQVTESFARGAVLVDGAGGRNYMVHTSRRTEAGMAEVHTQDADIIYVMSGSATLVTGGTVVEGKNTAADEIRGSAIRGGETRNLAPGDVVIVPAGVPHWFQRVSNPFTYYVVKAR